MRGADAVAKNVFLCILYATCPNICASEIKINFGKGSMNNRSMCLLHAIRKSLERIPTKKYEQPFHFFCYEIGGGDQHFPFAGSETFAGICIFEGKVESVWVI